MRFSRRGLLIGGGAVAATTIAGGALAQRPQAFQRATPIEVTAQSISRLSVSNPDRTRFGALNFRSGLELKSPVSAFGGFSGLWRSGNGQDIIALADNAQYLKARIETADGHLSGLSRAIMVPLILENGKVLRSSRYYDTEGLAVSGSTAYVGVERNHALIRFQRARDGTLVRGVPLPVPDDVKNLPSNGGLEAVGIAPQQSALEGAVVAIAEGAGKGFILTGPRQGSFEVERSGGYSTTDLAFLPNGDALLLERRFSLFGFSCRLRRVEAGMIRPKGRIDGEVIYESEASHQIDNMEGLAVHQDGGETVLTLISDNNFSALQRTLLLEFALAG